MSRTAADPNKYADQMCTFNPTSRLPAWLRTRLTMLIGTSTQSAAFSEQIVKQMASKVERPIIMPLSNPTSKAEALPGYLIRWIGGRALVATGSPFEPVVYEERGVHTDAGGR